MSHVGVLRHAVSVAGRPVTVGGVGGVVTLPEAQKKGYAGRLMRRAAEFFARGAAVQAGFLFCLPHMVDYYEKLGWPVHECHSPGTTARRPHRIADRRDGAADRRFPLAVGRDRTRQFAVVIGGQKKRSRKNWKLKFRTRKSPKFTAHARSMERFDANLVRKAVQNGRIVLETAVEEKKRTLSVLSLLPANVRWPPLTGVCSPARRGFSLCGRRSGRALRIACPSLRCKRRKNARSARRAFRRDR